MRSQWSILIALLGIAALSLPGCGASEPDLEENTIMTVDSAQKSREMFDKYDGDYNALTDADRQTYLSYHNNDEAKAKSTWELMANPPTR